MILQRTVVWIVVKQKPSLHPERVDTIVYTEKGTVHCILSCYRRTAGRIEQMRHLVGPVDLAA